MISPAQPLDILKQNSLRFLNEYIKAYVIEDLKKLKTIEANEDGLGACAIPTAMTIISTMDLLGFLINATAKTDASTSNISFYLNFRDLFGNRMFPNYYDSDSIQLITDYRGGMMHHFFPKFRGKFAGILKDKISPNLVIKHDEFGGQAQSLNVAVLQIDFESSIEQLTVFMNGCTDYDFFFNVVVKLKDLEYYLNLLPSPMTTMMPGTPQNRRNSSSSQENP